MFSPINLLRFAAAVFVVCGLLAQANNPQALAEANRGVKEAQQSNYSAAIAAYQRAIAIDPTLPDIYFNLGLAYFKEGNFREALKAFDKQNAKAPNQRISLLMGMSYFGLHQYREAASELAPVAASQPENPELSYVLAKAYLWSKQGPKAMQVIEQLVARDPNSAPVHMLLGEALDADGRTAEATAEFAQAAKIAPQQPDVHFGLGYLYWRQHNYTEAEREFREELKRDPKNAQASGYLGDVLLKMSRKAEALEPLMNSVAWQPDLYVPRVDLGILDTEKKDYNAAAKQFQAAIHIDPDGYNAHYRLARLYEQMGKPADAREQFAIVQKLQQKKEEEPLMRISGPQ